MEVDGETTTSKTPKVKKKKEPKEPDQPKQEKSKKPKSKPKITKEPEDGPFNIEFLERKVEKKIEVPKIEEKKEPEKKEEPVVEPPEKPKTPEPPKPPEPPQFQLTEKDFEGVDIEALQQQQNLVYFYHILIKFLILFY